MERSKLSAAEALEAIDGDSTGKASFFSAVKPVLTVKVKAESLFETLNMPRSPMACGF